MLACPDLVLEPGAAAVRGGVAALATRVYKIE